MATDGDIDFTTYTREQLGGAVTRLDRERYPINARRLIDEYERRRVEEKKAAALARESGSAMTSASNLQGANPHALAADIAALYEPSVVAAATH
jgi:hypothetical protein